MLWGLCFLQLLAQLYLNGGSFCFTLDDPYIHLALAENLWEQGHYGVNAQEYSAPSSSIVWPFLIAPLSATPLGLLLVNLVFASATIVVFSRVLRRWLIPLSIDERPVLESGLMVGLIVATNQVGLVFLGMEHSLQLLVAALLADAVLQGAQVHKLAPWVWPVAVFGVLVRYEMLALLLGVLVVGWIFGQRRAVLLTLVSATVVLAGFSWRLVSMGLGVLPSSIRAKVAADPGSGLLAQAGGQILRTLSHPQGIQMLLGLGVLAYLGYPRLKAQRFSIQKEQAGAIALLTACLGHFAVGKYGWFSRYEVYVWCFFLLVGGALAMQRWGSRIEELVQRWGLGRLSRHLSLTLMASSFLYVWALVIGPLGSNNIFEQQYQMHRLLRDYYDHPVAVNDLGWVAYHNKNYVLDLWGLGSEQARKARFAANTSSDWMERLAEQRGVSLVMVYDAWFAQLPTSWQRVGTLSLGKERITPAHAEVAFYLTKSSYKNELCVALQHWQRELPAGVIFESTCAPSIR